MSYRSAPYETPRQAASLSRLMLAGLVAFVVISLVVMFAGQVPFQPKADLLNYERTSVDYRNAAQQQLTTYARGTDGSVQIPIERAMTLLIEQNRIPVRAANP
jgi:hypothetical protein